MPISTVDLERQLKTVAKTGKYIVGRKEVLHGLKGSKLLVWSGSAGVPPQILRESRNLSIPAIRFEGSPIDLGKACGIPYKVSVFAVKSPGDAALSQFETYKDYRVDGEETTETMLAEPIEVQNPKSAENKISKIQQRKKVKDETKEDQKTQTKTSRKSKKLPSNEEESREKERKKRIAKPKKLASTEKKDGTKEEEPTED